MVEVVLPAFGFRDDTMVVAPFGNGLINTTWKVIIRGEEYILQKINDQVFSRPEDIAHNINAIATFLRKNQPDYNLVAPLPALNGNHLVFVESLGYFRVFRFIRGSHAKDVITTSEQAFEAAAQFGRFTCKLSAFDITTLKITIPAFHDLTFRYRQFINALETGNKARIYKAATILAKIRAHAGIEAEYRWIISERNVKLRVTHHDTKISNVLFNSEDKALCVIDLDTVMPGYFFSDVGDMMRTYLSPVDEEEVDFSKITIREEIYQAIVKGYYNEMKDVLTATEKKLFYFSGKFIIYMQALRFITDYINNDIYYGARHTEHNLDRAGNQLTLLERLIEKEEVFVALHP